jgi:hypothetical protein
VPGQALLYEIGGEGWPVAPGLEEALAKALGLEKALGLKRAPGLDEEVGLADDVLVLEAVTCTRRPDTTKPQSPAITSNRARAAAPATISRLRDPI